MGRGRRGERGKPGALQYVAVGLFSGIFVVVGLAMLCYVLGGWWTYVRSGSWQRVPATIVASRLVEHGGGGDTRYSVEATYTYEFGGRAFTGQQVDIWPGSDSQRFHWRRNRKLQDYAESGKPFTAYVNPKAPAQALLFRTPSDTMLFFLWFGLICPAVGVLSGAWGFKTLRGTRAETPWLLRADWRACKVRASTPRDLLAAWLGVVGLGLFLSLPVLGAMAEGVPLWVRLVVLAFVVGWAGLALRGLMLAVSQVLYGTLELLLEELPMVPGRPVRAILLSPRAKPTERWRCSLRCTEKRWQRTANGARLKRRVLFVASVSPADSPFPHPEGGTALPFELTVPDLGIESAETQEGSVVWTFRLRQEGFPWLLFARFELPVYAVQEQHIQKTWTPYWQTHAH